MSSVISGNLVKEARIRKKWQQQHVLYNLPYEDARLSRVENAHLAPRSDTFRSFMDAMYMPVEPLFCPYLENQTMDVFTIRAKILILLDDPTEEGCGEVEMSLRELENRGGFEGGINRQFILSCQAQVNEFRRTNPDELVAIIKEGIALTYEEFDESDFDGDMLIFEESNLLHTLANTYQRQGKSSTAIPLLYRIHEGISRLPEDDREKEKKLAPLLLTLTNFLIQEKKYSKALESCLKGNTASIKRNKGKYTPELMKIMNGC